MHLLADASENEALADWYDFPWAQFFASLGFLAIFFVEQFAHSIADKSTSKEKSASYHEESDAIMEITQHGSSVTAYILFLALSFHSILEGLGLGADEFDMGVFLAIVAHKGLPAFALGGFIHKACKTVAGKLKVGKFLSFAFIFSLMTPIGIIIGMIVESEAEDAAASGVCVALSAGTFIYVAVMEVIPFEFASKYSNRMTKSIALFLGYAFFGLLALW